MRDDVVACGESEDDDHDPPMLQAGFGRSCSWPIACSAVDQTRVEGSEGYARYWARFWAAEPRSYATVSAGERDRVDAIIELVPKDGGTVLDVGCGDGLVTNRLHELGFDVTGVDIEVQALAAVSTATRVGSVDGIPAADREFDCVLACDVLEHLPSGVFEAALAELARVARRSLVLNSPNEERLALAQTRCDRCETAFHSSRHVRSISTSELSSWFPEFEVRAVRLCGERIRPRARWLHRLGQLVANSWHVAPAAVCPNCGYPVRQSQPRRLAWAAFVVAHRVLGLFTAPRPTEFAALLVRREP